MRAVTPQTDPKAPDAPDRPSSSSSSSSSSSAPPPSSQRPSFDILAIASVAGLRDSRGNLPLDHCVPVRTWRPTPPTIGRDEIYVLLYADGVATLKEIAVETNLSLKETIKIFIKLLTQGLVETVDTPTRRAAETETRR